MSDRLTPFRVYIQQCAFVPNLRVTLVKYPAILSLLVIGVVSCHSDRALHPRISADLSDANHGTNTNQFFFWLPPVINQSAPSSQVFSQQLSPFVIITDEGLGTFCLLLGGNGEVIQRLLKII